MFHSLTKTPQITEWPNKAYRSLLTAVKTKELRVRLSLLKPERKHNLLRTVLAMIFDTEQGVNL